MDQNFILGDDGKTPVPVELMAWAEWFKQADRTVTKTDVGEVQISTVFLGLNHAFGDGPPLLFETMIFGGEHDEYCEGCSTWDQAVEQHETALNLVGPK